MTRNQQANQFSNRLFTRFYVVLVGLLMILGSGLQYVLNRMDEAQLIRDIKLIHQPLFASISQVLSVHDADQWDQLLNDIQQRTETDLWLMSLADFTADADTLEQLSNGQMLVLFDVDDQLTLYRRMEASEQVLGITPQTRLNQEQRLWVLPVFYLLLALGLYVLIRPFARQLLQLKQAAADLGQGDFTARVEVPASTTLAPIADAFNAMIRKIEQLMLTQRDLVNAVSHELRTPLARLKFAFEALENDTDRHALADTVAAMRTDVRELETLIDEMLRYAEVNQTDAFQTQPLNIRDWLTGLLNQHVSDQIEVRLDLDPSITADQVIMCDELQLSRAVSNVLRNALSFASAQCRLSAAVQADQLVIEVADDGPGLDALHAQRIFEPFFTVKNQRRKAGYGLGLSIARKIVHKHHGELSITHGSLSGACFRFTLPLG
jgi:signal transduction histidine kinase